MGCLRALVAAASLALTVALAACASKAPTYAHPSLPVPDAYPVAFPPDGVAPDAAAGTLLPEWRAYFLDARLQSLIELALAHNRGLRGAVLRVDE